MGRMTRRLWQQCVTFLGVVTAAGAAVALYHHHVEIPPPPPQAREASPPAIVHHDAEWIEPQGIILHSSDSPWHYGKKIVTADFLDKMHEEDHPKWATTFEGKTYHIGYHYVVLPDGSVQQGRPEHCRGTHARHFNDWLGICSIGAFSSDSNPRYWPHHPTPDQVAALVALCERLMLEYHIPPERIRRHADVNDTRCPGERFPYHDIMLQLRAFASAHPEIHSGAELPLTSSVRL